MAVGSALPDFADVACKIVTVLLVGLIFLRRKQPAVVFALVVFAFVFTGAWTPGLNRIEMTRSFFGVHQVIDTADGAYRVLMHGTTIHGAARLRGESGGELVGRPEPLTYYYFGGPISEAIEATRTRTADSRTSRLSDWEPALLRAIARTRKTGRSMRSIRR